MVSASFRRSLARPGALIGAYHRSECHISSSEPNQTLWAAESHPPLHPAQSPTAIANYPGRRRSSRRRRWIIAAQVKILLRQIHRPQANAPRPPQALPLASPWTSARRMELRCRILCKLTRYSAGLLAAHFDIVCIIEILISVLDDPHLVAPSHRARLGPLLGLAIPSGFSSPLQPNPQSSLCTSHRLCPSRVCIMHLCPLALADISSCSASMGMTTPSRHHEMRLDFGHIALAYLYSTSSAPRFRATGIRLTIPLV
ncbi:hypothetical protein K438DRAFT_455817 [Mycena galopus ATCC 62051]|nr:hypothetical protein K438DRAFT_455817 [Mycena galopus ATCC 62051]